VEGDRTDDAPRRRRLRPETGEERVLVGILAAGLVFLVFSVAQAAKGSHTHRPRSRPAAQVASAPAVSSSAVPTPRATATSGTTAGTVPPTPSPRPAPLLHMLEVRTEPPVPDASFSFAGTTFTSDPRSGVALLLISAEEHARLVGDPPHELAVTTPVVPLWRARAVFAGWAGPVTPDGSVDTAVARFRVAA
jgi:hypothetical protein